VILADPPRAMTLYPAMQARFRHLFGVRERCWRRAH
jgi:hypothetical protein